jgi:hypothetical protein
VTSDPAGVPASIDKDVGSEHATPSDNQRKRGRPTPTPVHHVRDGLDGDTLDDVATPSDDVPAIDLGVADLYDMADHDSFDFDFLQEPPPSQPSSTRFDNAETSVPLTDSMADTGTLLTESSPSRAISPKCPAPCPRTKQLHAKAPLAEVDQNVGGRRSNRTRVITEKAKALTATVSDEWLTEALEFFRGEDLGTDWVRAVDQWEAIERERGPVWAPKPVVRAIP